MEVVCTQAQKRGRWWQELEGAAAAQSPGLEFVLASPMSDPGPFLLAAPSREVFCLFIYGETFSLYSPQTGLELTSTLSLSLSSAGISVLACASFTE